MAEAKTEEGRKGEKKKQGGGAKLVVLMALIGCMVPFGIPTLIVCIGLVPTLVALLTDTDQNRSSLATIGYLNFAGVLPFLIDLWSHGQTMAAAMAIVRQPSSWVIMLGAAGIGHLILYAVPPVIASVVLINEERRLKTLREGLQQLEAIWGTEVTNSTPLDIVRQSKGL